MASLGLSLGALEVGVLLSTLLFGVTTVQVYNYHSGNFKDPLWLKTFVYTVWVLEFFHTLFLWIYIYRLTVTHFGDAVQIGLASWELSASALFNGFLDGMVQAYFAWRIWILSEQIYITLISWAGSLVHLAFNTAIAAVAGRPHQTLAVVTAKFGWILTVTLTLTFVVDIINTSSLCYFLYTKRSDQSTTNKLVDKLIIWTIETGMLTTIAATLMLITSLVEKDTALWVAISLFYAKFYSNSLLISLNRRRTLRQGTTGSSGIQSLSSRSKSSMQRAPVRSVRGEIEAIELASSPGVRVHVDTTTDADRYEDVFATSQSKFADA